MKTVAFLLVSLLLVSFSACSEKAEEEEKVEEVQEETSTKELSNEVQKARARAKEAGASDKEIQQALEPLEIAERGNSSGNFIVVALFAVGVGVVAILAFRKTSKVDERLSRLENEDKKEEEESGAGGAGTTALILFLVFSASFFCKDVSAEKMSIEDRLQETNQTATLNGLAIDYQQKADGDRDAKIESLTNEIKALRIRVSTIESGSEEQVKRLTELEALLGGFASKEFVDERISLKTVEFGGSEHKRLLRDICKARGIDLASAQMPTEGELCPAQKLKVLIEGLKPPKDNSEWAAWKETRDQFSVLLDEAVASLEPEKIETSVEPKSDSGFLTQEMAETLFMTKPLEADMVSRSWVNQQIKNSEKKQADFWIDSGLGWEPSGDGGLEVFRAAREIDLELSGVLTKIDHNGKKVLKPTRVMWLETGIQSGIVKIDKDGRITEVKKPVFSEDLKVVEIQIKEVKDAVQKNEDRSILNGQSIVFSSSDSEFFKWCRGKHEISVRSLFDERVGAPQLIGKRYVEKDGYVKEKNISKFIKWFQKGMEKVGSSDPIKATDRLLSNFDFGVEPE